MLKRKLSKLKEEIRKMESAAVAYSGGIDSTFLLKVVHDCLGEKAIGITAVSASVPKAEINEAKSLALGIGVKHILLNSHEMEDPRYIENTENRCYFCKTNAYDEIFQFAQKENIRFVLDGTNADDVDDHRPGRIAAKENGVRSPLQENGINKAEIRELARELGLPNWNKPAAACLSSRIPYGSSVTVKKLSQIEQAEQVLKEMGFGQLRVRYHDQVARIEIEPNEFDRALKNRNRIIQSLKSIGFKYVTLDLSGFRSGSMNEVLKTDG